ncbi:hypothetical protein C8R44DRAFT_878966 [Mycena epipterygia]|nr:hypothetical protein C8R44DRAFT_878966 [Mycena epipterygia]
MTSFHHSYAAGDISGSIGFASVQLGTYKFEEQAFMNANSTGARDILEDGLDGLIGLAFDGRGPSPLTDALQNKGFPSTAGQPFLYNIFDQTPEFNNFIGISLSRTNDLEDTADAAFTINSTLGSEAGTIEFDGIFGDTIMRNVYSVFNFGDSVAKSPTGNATMQLLS